MFDPLSSYLIEPVGMKGPKFSTNSKITSFDVIDLNPISLFCEAQGYPIPSFK